MRTCILCLCWRTCARLICCVLLFVCCVFSDLLFSHVRVWSILCRVWCSVWIVCIANAFSYWLLCINKKILAWNKHIYIYIYICFDILACGGWCLLCFHMLLSFAHACAFVFLFRCVDDLFVLSLVLFVSLWLSDFMYLMLLFFVCWLCWMCVCSCFNLFLFCHVLCWVCLRFPL